MHSPRPSSATPSPGPPGAARAVLTLVAVAHGAKVHIVLVVGEEEEAEPGVEGVDGHDEEDADDVALLVGAAIAAQVHVDLGAEGPGQSGPTARLGPPAPQKEETSPCLAPSSLALGPSYSTLSLGVLLCKV